MPDPQLHLVRPSAAVHLDASESSARAPAEDLEREPDGVPHEVVALDFVFSFLLAIAVVVIFVAVSPVVAVALAVVGIAWMVSRLRAKAERERDHVHPSR